MSADLFAEFGDFAQDAQQQPTQVKQQIFKPADQAADPFSFLASPASQNVQSSEKWPGLINNDQHGSTWGGLSGSTIKFTKDVGDDEDTWGDFEVASPITESAPIPTSAKAAAPAPINRLTQAPQRTRIVRASTMDLMTNNLVEIGAASSQGPPSAKQQFSWADPAVKQQPPRLKNTDPNVLFDADDYDPDEVAAEEDEDDDFGDFESVAAPVKPPAPAPVLDILSDWPPPSNPAPPGPKNATKQPPSQLLSTLNLNDNTNYPQPPRSPSFQERNPFPGLAVTTPIASEFPTDDKPASPTPVTVWPSLEKSTKASKTSTLDDPWGTFDDFSSDKNNASSGTATGWDWDAVDNVQSHSAVTKPPKPPIQNQHSTQPASDWDWDSTNTTPAPAAENNHPSVPDTTPPPTNVPPPSILLSIIPALFDLPNTALFKPTTGQTTTLKTRILSDPKTIVFLRAFLLLATVAARLIAGRKLRWHRDKFLSQGMAISAAGGKGGMKLAGVDKTQAAHEDREAADVLAVWRQHVGRLRSAVAAANSGIAEEGRQLRVPELAEGAAVQAAKMVPTAARPCVVCGLKREERVKGVDVEVEDSFGEWWVEHWGHRACRNFWLEHEATLRSR